jgi:hydroxymethylpyrimidine pyrophosphatase-like HAD family hydrolase
MTKLKKIIYVDIDETICFYQSKEHRLGYRNAIPNYKYIEKINKLYNEGHEITYWTARGSVSKNDYYDLTKSQLETWGCKYHYLNVGKKPPYDLLICDKTKRIEEI